MTRLRAPAESVPYGPLPIPYAILDEEDAREAAGLFAEAHDRLANLEVETRAYGGGSPAMVMTTRAEREDADLLVVGSPHRGAIGRAIMGSVTHGLLHGAPCAVVVAPRGYAEGDHVSLRTIAVAYDGTPESKAALDYVPPHPPEPEKLIIDAINSVDSALAADGRVLEGQPSAKLAGACEDDIDLILAGSRRYGPGDAGAARLGLDGTGPQGALPGHGGSSARERRSGGGGFLGRDRRRYRQVDDDREEVLDDRREWP